MDSSNNLLKTQNRIKLIILWLIPFALMLVASVVYWLVVNGHLTLNSKNEGELVMPPINIHELALTIDKTDRNEWKGKWVMLIRGSNKCSGTCEDALHLTRQIHIRLNEKADRVTVNAGSKDASLHGKDIPTIIAELETKMRDAAANLEFEEAARLRDELKRIENKQLGLDVPGMAKSAQNTNLKAKTKSFVNSIGSVFLGISTCLAILFVGFNGKQSIINSPILNFEITQTGSVGMFVKYQLAAFLGIFAISMLIQFVSYYFLSLSNKGLKKG